MTRRRTLLLSFAHLWLSFDVACRTLQWKYFLAYSKKGDSMDLLGWSFKISFYCWRPWGILSLFTLCNSWTPCVSSHGLPEYLRYRQYPMALINGLVHVGVPNHLKLQKNEIRGDSFILQSSLPYHSPSCCHHHRPKRCNHLVRDLKFSLSREITHLMTWYNKKKTERRELDFL